MVLKNDLEQKDGQFLSIAEHALVNNDYREKRMQFMVA